ncbi:TonB-dependent receptor [Paraburkholderia phosphatilytica]|uniref:TonB-dependent receptor n=1 Tax=Paraburkholderia phosphatilytica TaxID=2282883 RepID=UPI000E489FE3|nr:TonB-dependent receptor [Paraburkholderia phosphatilytica]
MNHRTLLSRAAALLFAQALSSHAFAADGASVDTPVHPAVSPTVASAPAGTVRGLVTGRDGKPVAHADVTLRDTRTSTSRSTTTAEDGRFSFDGVPRGAYMTEIAAPGYANNDTATTLDATHGVALDVTLSSASSASTSTTADGTLNVTVTAQRLDRARNGLSPETGSSVYRIGEKDIEAMPQGENTPLNQVLLQAPGVANDSYGQLHVRGDHADLQYRINGIIVPEPISGFGQSFDTRIIDQVSLITGALPAEYGYRTAGIVDIRTKSGDASNGQSGGSIDVYGGSHQTIQTSADVFGSSGALSYYFTGSLGENNLGIEAPTSDGSPLHDHTRQGDGFGYLSYLLNPFTRVSVMFGATSNQFELPNTPGLPTNFTLNGSSTFNSANLNETQSELNNFALVALQGTNGDALDYQVAFFTRYTRTQFNPDPVGDLMFNGVASTDFHSNQANGVQADTTWRLGDNHTLRAGIWFQQEHAVFDDSVAVFPADADGNQLSDVPFNINDAASKTGYLTSAYVQDEWKLSDKLTLNYGVRYDKMNEYVSVSQLSPRIGIVWQPTSATTFHAGYARYFTPPAFELVSDSTISRFNGTTNQSAVTQNDPVQPERDHYFDIGVSQRLTPALTVGLDAYYKKATQLLDEGQFGAALIYTPFNYAEGHVYGVEFTTNYRQGNVSAYLNVAYSRAEGTNVDSAQFNFSPDELAYIANHYVYLDHDQRITASFGGSYTLGRTLFSLDGIVGSGLRAGFANTDKLPWYAQINLGVTQHFQEPLIGKFDARVVFVNAFDRVYELRDGSGIGVGAPQYGPQRAIYAGLTKHF